MSVNESNHKQVKKALSAQNLMPKRVYRFRVLGMALAAIAIGAVLLENQVSMGYWVWWFSCCFLWPHLAYFQAFKSQQPFQAERNNLLMDSFIAGSWVSLMWFNLLPAVLLVVVTTADKISSGIKNIWLFSQSFLIFGLIAAGLLTGFVWQTETSMTVIMASLPLLVIHTLLVSIGAYQLIRKVQKQNQRLNELSQKDPLTQLYNWRQWQIEASQLLKSHNKIQQPLTLVVIDIDHFKQINDRFGHSVGDDVLMAIAQVIQNSFSVTAVAGRLGGDEFAIVTACPYQEAQQSAENTCQQVAELKFAKAEGLVCTVSIGVSTSDGHSNQLRSWFDRTDKILYEAKTKGRNQVLCADAAVGD